MSILHFYPKNHSTLNFMLIGYARVSTIDENTDLRANALKTTGCQKIFIDKISGVKSGRPELNKLKEHVDLGDGKYEMDSPNHSKRLHYLS